MSDIDTDFNVADLRLDARQRAMLDEMGIKVWWPEGDAADGAQTGQPDRAGTDQPTRADAASVTGSTTAVAPLPEAPASAHEQPHASAAPPARATLPRPASAPAHAGAAAPDAARAGAANALGAGILVDAPRHLFGAANASGGWLIVADMPPDLQGRHGAPLEGDEGRLLANMLRALKLDAGEVPVHLVRTHRGDVISGGDDVPQPVGRALAPHLGHLAPRIVLAMGPLSAQYLLQRREPIGKLRGPATPLAGQPGAVVLATYHPAYLLRNGAEKGRAWVDLCAAAAAFAGAGS